MPDPVESFDLAYIREYLRNPRAVQHDFLKPNVLHIVWMLKSFGLMVETSNNDELLDINEEQGKWSENLKLLHIEFICTSSGLVSRLKYQIPDYTTGSQMLPFGWHEKEFRFELGICPRCSTKNKPVLFALKQARAKIDVAIAEIESPQRPLPPTMPNQVVLPFKVDLIEISHLLVNHEMELVLLEHRPEEMNPAELGLLKVKFTLAPSGKSTLIVFRQPICSISPTVINVGPAPNNQPNESPNESGHDEMNEDLDLLPEDDDHGSVDDQKMICLVNDAMKQLEVALKCVEEAKETTNQH